MELADLREQIYEAVQALKRLPDREASYLRSGSRCAWPQVIVSYWEAYGQQRARSRPSPPTASEIDAMERVLGWLTWLGQQDRIVMRCVFLCCGQGMQSTQAGYILRLHRNTVRIKRDAGMAMILAKLDTVQPVRHSAANIHTFEEVRHAR